MEGKNFYVYILTNAKNGTLYTGVTNDLKRRVTQHREHRFPDSFSAKYGTTMLVYYEHTTDILAAIRREKQIKGGSRKKKIELIEKMNRDWRDLFDSL